MRPFLFSQLSYKYKGLYRYYGSSNLLFTFLQVIVTVTDEDLKVLAKEVISTFCVEIC